MSILVVFNLRSMNSERYDQVIKGLEAAGQGNPKGRLHHVGASQEDGSIVVTDVWESAESLDQFGKILMPILENAGVTPVEPNVFAIHNVISG